MLDEPFYARGLCFSCTRCSSCCRHDSGFVFLSEIDVAKLTQACGMRYNEFVKTYCRWVWAEAGECLSLREKSNFDCIFWDKGCTVYNARPLQCRTFPFWDSITVSSVAWEAAAAECPGMNHGVLHGREEIELALSQRYAEPLITRSGDPSPLS